MTICLFLVAFTWTREMLLELVFSIFADLIESRLAVINRISNGFIEIIVTTLSVREK
jgi:hypothetical protein